jgi:hypothetical protein
LNVRSGPPTTGNVDSSDFVSPTTYTLPSASIAKSRPISVPLPDRSVAHDNVEPSAATLATNASLVPAPAVWNAPSVVGKSSMEVVTPATYTLPSASTSIPWGLSYPVPPMKPA